MALIFGDGFNLYSVAADMIGHWTSSAAVTLVTGRFQGNAISISNSTSGLSKTLGASYTSLIAMADFKRVLNNANNISVIRFFESSTIHITLYSNADNTLSIARNTTVLGTTSASIPVNTWAHIQLRATIGSSGSATLYINGEEALDIPNDNTQNGGAGIINVVSFHASNSANSAQFDNIAVCSTTGAAPNSLGVAQPRFYILSPTSGFQENFAPGTDNALNVDDIPSNGDTDYNSSSTLDALDLFNMQDFPIATAEIYAVMSRVIARKEDSGTRSIAPVFRINSTNYIEADTSIGTNYTSVYSIASTNPNTTNEWIVDDIDGLQAGYKITL